MYTPARPTSVYSLFLSVFFHLTSAVRCNFRSSRSGLSIVIIVLCFLVTEGSIFLFEGSLCTAPLRFSFILLVTFGPVLFFFKYTCRASFGSPGAGIWFRRLFSSANFPPPVSLVVPCSLFNCFYGKDERYTFTGPTPFWFFFFFFLIVLFSFSPFFLLDHAGCHPRS